MKTSRRSFLVMSAAAVGTSTLRAAGTPIRLGAPIFLKSDDPVILAKEHRRLGYSAAFCPQIATIKDGDLIRAIQKAYAAESVVIAEVGAWKNMLDPDGDKRRQNQQYVV